MKLWSVNISDVISWYFPPLLCDNAMVSGLSLSWPHWWTECPRPTRDSRCTDLESTFPVRRCFEGLKMSSENLSSLKWLYAKQLFVRVNLLSASIGPAPQQLSDLPIGIGQTIQICFHCWQDLTSSLTSSKEMWIECWIAWSLDPFYILMLHGIGSWCEQKKRAAGSGSIQFLVRYHTSVFLVVYCQESVDVVLMQKMVQPKYQYDL